MTTEILNVFTILLTGFFGIYALLNDYKDKSGKITKHGKVAAYGIILSGTISLIGIGVNVRKAMLKEMAQIESYEAQIERHNKTLTEINRVQLPITSIKFRAELAFPDLAVVNILKDTLQEFVKRYEYLGGDSPFMGMEVSFNDTVKVTTSVTLSEDSNIYPTEENNFEICQIAGLAKISTFIGDINIDSIQSIQDIITKADIHCGDLAPDNDTFWSNYKYYPKDNLFGLTCPFSKEKFKRKLKLFKEFGYVHDLLGAKLIVVSNIFHKEDEIFKFRLMGEFQIEINNFRIEIDYQKFKRIELPEGRLYYFQFPEQISQLEDIISNGAYLLN